MLTKEQITKAVLIKSLIEKANGTVVGVTFTKADGTPRTMAFRKGVKHSKLSGDVKGTAPEATAKRKATNLENGCLSVHDQNNGYSTINLVTVSRLRIKGNTILFPVDVV